MREIPENSTPIIHEIIEALAKIRLSCYEFNILMAIIRKTYGWGKKEDWIAGEQLVEMTGIAKPRCFNTLKKLKEKNIIFKNGKNTGINKNVTEWVVLPKQIQPTTQTGIKLLPKQVPTKETNTKETLTKERATAQKKERNFIDGETYRGKTPQFDALLDYCAKKKIKASISPQRYFQLEEEFRGKTAWWEETKGCIDWLFDNHFKQITAQRLRRRMNNSIKFAKDRERKMQEEKHEKKVGNVEHSAPKISSPQPKLYDCKICKNVVTYNPKAVCDLCDSKILPQNILRTNPVPAWKPPA